MFPLHREMVSGGEGKPAFDSEWNKWMSKQNQTLMPSKCGMPYVV